MCENGLHVPAEQNCLRLGFTLAMKGFLMCYAGLTELCADFSEIMRNFFPNYAVKIANYAGIMRIAQYLL